LLVYLCEVSINYECKIELYNVKIGQFQMLFPLYVHTAFVL